MEQNHLFALVIADRNNKDISDPEALWTFIGWNSGIDYYEASTCVVSELEQGEDNTFEAADNSDTLLYIEEQFKYVVDEAQRAQREFPGEEVKILELVPDPEDEGFIPYALHDVPEREIDHDDR